MNVILCELKMMRNATMVWVCALCGVLLLYISLYPTFSHDAELTRTTLAHIPASIQGALGVNIDVMLSFVGYFAFICTNVTLFAAIHAMYVGLSVVSRENRSKMAEFLFAKPRNRTSLFIQKYCAGVVVIVITWASMVIASLGFAQLFDAGTFNIQYIGMVMIALLSVQLWFFMCGAWIAIIRKNITSPVGTTLAVVFGFFIVAMLSKLLDDDRLRFLSPFTFFDYMTIVTGGGYEVVYGVYAGISACLLLVTAYIRYRKRDIGGVV